jgi:hypothetical protein
VDLTPRCFAVCRQSRGEIDVDLKRTRRGLPLIGMRFRRLAELAPCRDAC